MGGFRATAWPLLVAALLAGSGEGEPAPRALNPAKALTQLGLETWTTEQGLPNATVNAVLETHEGYVWLATYDGLARFDGSGFKVFDKAYGLGSNGIRALCEDRDGALWIGTNGGGIARMERGRITRFTTASGLPSDIVWSLRTDVRDGSVWIGTNGGGLARYRGGRIERFGTGDSGQAVVSIAQADDGTLWLGTQGDGIRRLTPDGRWTTYSKTDGIPLGLVTCVTLARDGTLWGGTSAGLFRIQGGRVVPLPPGLDALRSASISAIIEDAAGTLWVGTNGMGLARFAGGVVSFLGSRDGLGDVVYSLYLEPGEALWIGTNGAGASRLRDGSFTTYTIREGLSRDFAYTTFEDRDGTIWAGTGGGLDRLEHGRFVPESPPVGRPVAVRSIAEGPDGALWIGTYGAGVWRLLHGRWNGYSVRDGLAGDNVRAVLVDRSGRVWAATTTGLSRLEGNSWRSFHVADGLPMDSLMGLVEDREDTLWIGTDGGGLARFQNGRFRVFTTRDGLASDLVLALFIDSGGILCVGTNGGLSRRNGDRFTSLTRTDGLPSDSVTQIVEDALKALWIGTSRGASRLSRASLERHDKNLRPLEIDSFDHFDGMKSSQCTAPGQPAGMRSRDGRLWFATTRGIATVDPARLEIDTRPPAIVVEQTTIDGRLMPFEPGIVVPAGSSRLEIGYAVLATVAPQRTSVRFRLEGFDADWVDAGDRRRAEYTGLPPGEYLFRIEARTNRGTWGGAGVTLPVRVRPRFFQTPIFVLVSMLAAVGVLTLGHRVRVRELRARERNLTRIVEERTHSLEVQKERAEQAHAHTEQLLLERERAELDLRRQGDYLNSLHETALAVMDRLEPDELLQTLVERATTLLESPDGFLYLETPDRARLECRVWVGSRPRDQYAGPDEGAVGRAWQGGEPVVVDEYDAWKWRSAQVPLGTFGAMLAVPLRSGGRVTGALGVAQAAGARHFTHDERRLLIGFAQLASLALDNTRLYSGIRDELAERMRAQHALELSESRFRDLFEQSLGLLCTHDLDGTLLSVNPAAATSLGRPVEELVGSRLQKYLPSELQARFESYLQLIRKEKAVSGTFVILDVRGERRTWRYRNVLREAPMGDPFVIGFAQDVSDEDATQDALRESEQRFRQLAENIDAAFFIRSTYPPALLYVSPAYERIWGRTGTPDLDEFLATVHPEDREALVGGIGRPEEGFDIEYRIVRPDGAIRWIRSRSFPVPDGKGRVFRVAGIAEDVTVRRSVEQMREDLTHTLVHDLRNPLNSMLVSIELLESSLSGFSEAERNILGLARRGGDRLRDLVDAILDVNRLEQGAMPLEPTSVGVAEVVAEILEVQRPLAGAANVRLLNVVPDDLPPVWADRALLSRILQNLVGNAIKFTPAGGAIRVRALADTGEAGMLRVEVEDDGSGIPEELRERLFGKFVTGRQKGRGSGLGLLFCRLAVEAQGGRIRAESPPGCGATFLFTLPLAHDESQGTKR